jgi:hypothetical protein
VSLRVSFAPVAEKFFDSEPDQDVRNAVLNWSAAVAEDTSSRHMAPVPGLFPATRAAWIAVSDEAGQQPRAYVKIALTLFEAEDWMRVHTLARGTPPLLS